MNTHLSVLALAAAMLLTAGPDPVAAPQPDDADVARARELVAGFMSELKGELVAAMRDGGPAGAISVCSEVAPRIAAELSAESGWSLGRTSLRVRNPRNAPDPAERAVLVDFEQRLAAGEDPADLESVRVVDVGGVRYLHYLKAISTAGLCLACHGQEVDPSVREAIAASYPADAATGFAKGDLRGAFTLVRPLD